MTIEEFIESALVEDLGDGDHSSLSTIAADARGKANLIVKSDGIIAGVDIAKKVFSKVDPELKIEVFITDGEQVKKGDIAFSVEGHSVSILSSERLVLNFMQRMSGIATETNKYVKAVEGCKAKILDTRKTTPNFRYFEKLSVKLGGGENHRFGLYDMVMIKDNHVDFAGGIDKAISAAQNYLSLKKKNLKIEIEVRNFEELEKVLKFGGVDRIMLDNFSPENMKKAVEIIASRYETEASGGITLENVREYAETGVDYISIGALTHQIKSLDLSLKAVNT
jgi:nicotinate-nucleotide pyrophosphorylase (carboxylating)